MLPIGCALYVGRIKKQTPTLFDDVLEQRFQDDPEPGKGKEPLGHIVGSTPRHARLTQRTSFPFSRANTAAVRAGLSLFRHKYLLRVTPAHAGAQLPKETSDKQPTTVQVPDLTLNNGSASVSSPAARCYRCRRCRDRCQRPGLVPTESERLLRDLDSLVRLHRVQRT